MTILEWGIACLVIAALLYWLGIFRRLQVIGGFVGTCIVTSGIFGEIVVKVARWLDGFTNAVVGKVFGVAVPGLLVIILAIIFIYDLHPRGGGGGSRRTLFVGILLAACLVAGLSSFQTLNTVPANVRNGVGNASTITGG
jgi:hypothetical protein